MGAYQLVQYRERITRASAQSILRCALLWLSTTLLATAQTNQPSVNFGSVPGGTATNEILHLKDRSDTLRVFLYAPRETKIRRLVTRGKAEKEAQALIDTVDDERAGFIKKYFNVEWPDRAIYHAMINTGCGDEATMRMILNFMNAYAPCAIA